MGTINPSLGTQGGPRGDGETALRAAVAALLAEFNGNIESSNIKDGSLAQGDLVAAVQQALHSPGDIKASGRASAETGWLACDGAAVSRSTYAALFAAIGTAYGAGDGSTTFNLPDLQGRMPVGKGTAATVDTLGESDGAAVGSRSPKHTHTGPSHTHSYSGDTDTGSLIAGPGASFVSGTNPHRHGYSGTTGASGTGTTSSSGPAYQVVNWYVKV